MENQGKAREEDFNGSLSNSKDKPFFIPEGVSICWKISLKDRVRFLLASKGMTQNQLADLIEINKGTLSKIINDNWAPTSKIKLLMAKYVGVDSLILFGDKKYFLDYQESIKKVDKNEISKK